MKRILFICVENAGRSQMAEAFAWKYRNNEYVFSSAGTNPIDKVNPNVVLVMKDKGIDLSKKKPKALTHDMIENADLIITMGCETNGICIGPVSKPSIDWKLEDPKTKSLKKVREIRDEIETRVKDLISVQQQNIKLKIKQNIPNVITLFRLIILPFLIYSFYYLNTLATFVIFLLAIGTDVIDGYIARKTCYTSKLGGYLDVIVDFFFITTMYFVFSFRGFYSPLILLLIIFMFVQFIVSNIILRQTIYDPIGKYFGTILFGGIGLTLLFSDELIYTIVMAGILISAFASLISRFVYLINQRRTS